MKYSARKLKQARNQESDALLITNFELLISNERKEQLYG